MKIIHKPTLGVKSVDIKNRTLSAVVSNEKVDRDREVVRQDGMDLKNFLKNPVLLDYHDDRKDPIGVITRISTDTKSDAQDTEVDIKFTSEEENPEGFRKFKLYAGGFLRAFSVGIFKKVITPKEGYDEITESELVEISSVAIGANPDAVIKAFKKGVLTKDEASDYLQDNEEYVKKLDIKKSGGIVSGMNKVIKETPTDEELTNKSADSIVSMPSDTFQALVDRLAAGNRIDEDQDEEKPKKKKEVNKDEVQTKSQATEKTEKANKEDEVETKSSNMRAIMRKELANELNGIKTALEKKGRVNITGDAKKDTKKHNLEVCRKFYKSLVSGKTMVEGTDSAGGYTVPTELSNELLRKRIAGLPLRRLVRTFTMNRDAYDQITHEGDTTAYIVAENSTITASDMSFGKISWKTIKIAGRTLISNELIADSTLSMINEINQNLSLQIARKEEDQIIVGTGSANTQYLGIDQEFKASGSGYTFTTVATPGTKDTIVYDDLVKLKRALKKQYWPGAIVICRPDILHILETITDGKTGKYAFTDAGSTPSSLRDADQDGWLLNQFPVYSTESLSATYSLPSVAASKGGVILLFNPEYYGFGRRAGIAVETNRYSTEAWTKDLTEVRAIARSAGRPTLNEAYSALAYRATT